MNSIQASNLFFSCGNLKEIYFSSLFNNIEVKSMSFMFYDCTILTSIDFTNFKIKNATSFVYMFKGCSSLKNIDISNLDISKVTNMKEMFYECKELESVQFPNIKTQNLTLIEKMFLWLHFFKIS